MKERKERKRRKKEEQGKMSDNLKSDPLGRKEKIREKILIS